MADELAETLQEFNKRLQDLERSQEVKLYRIGQAERMEERLQQRLDRLDSEFKGEIREYSTAHGRDFNEFVANQNQRLASQDKRIERLQNALYVFSAALLAFAGSILWIVSQHH